MILRPVRSDAADRFVILAFLLTFVPILCLAQAPPKYTITTIAGQLGQTANFAGDGGPATNALLAGPHDVIVDSLGNIYFSDTNNNRIRMVDPSSGNIRTVVGDGAAGYSGDGGSATASGNNGAELQAPSGIAFDANGNLYIADTGNFVVREVYGANSANAGNITTVAGDNSLGANYSGDSGPATSATLYNPSSVALDSGGNLYIADPANNVVRVVCQNHTPAACETLPPGDIFTIAGNFAEGQNYTGDGGPAILAQLNDPTAVAVDSAGNLYISDSGNNAIRMVTLKGVITTVVGDGTGNPGYLGDGGPANKAELNDPKGIAFDSSGNLYIADSVNSVIRVVVPVNGSIANGTIYTIAGKQAAGGGDFGDNGPATSAQLNFPSGVAAYGGKVYIADNSNNAIRMLTPPAQVPTINAGGVVNGASYTAPVVPGSIADVFGGFFLSSATESAGLPLSRNLLDLSLQFSGGTETPLYFVSGTQVNLQVPWELAGQSSATLAATLAGQTGAAQTVSLAPYAPAIFTLSASGSGPGAILDSSYHVIGPSNPAVAGTTYLLIYCTGLGAVTQNQPATGAAASLTDLAPTVITPTVTIGGVQATPIFSGLAPGYVGLYQVNVLVPAGVASGSSVPVSLTMGEVNSNTVTVPVQ